MLVVIIIQIVVLWRSKIVINYCTLKFITIFNILFMFFFFLLLAIFESPYPQRIGGLHVRSMHMHLICTCTLPVHARWLRVVSWCVFPLYQLPTDIVVNVADFVLDFLHVTKGKNRGREWEKNGKKEEEKKERDELLKR